MSTAENALTELADISTQVRAAALFEPDGKVIASTLADERTEDFVSAVRHLLEQAQVVRGEADTKITQVEVSTPDGSVFLVREGDRVVAAATPPEPTTGLVFYDLKACLRAAVDEKKPRRRKAVGSKAAKPPKPKASGSS